MVTSPEFPSVNLRTSVPPSSNVMIPLAESSSICAPESTIIGLAAIVSPVVPSWVSVASFPSPKLITDESELRIRSSVSVKSVN